MDAVTWEAVAWRSGETCTKSRGTVNGVQACDHRTNGERTEPERAHLGAFAKFDKTRTTCASTNNHHCERIRESDNGAPNLILDTVFPRDVSSCTRSSSNLAKKKCFMSATNWFTLNELDRL